MNALPVASVQEVRSYARRVMLRHRRELAIALLLHALATVAGLVAPRMLGELVGDAQDGHVAATRVALVICAAVVSQALLLRLAVFASARLGERVLAELREEFVDNLFALPVATVEKAGSGDLVTRTTRDVDVLARTVQTAVPDTLISAFAIALTLGAIALTDPVLVLPCLVAVPVLWISTRWYLARARAGYLRSNGMYSQLNEGLTETVEGARTVEALRLRAHRSRRVDADIAESYAAERRTLYLRSVYLPIADTGYILPVAATLVIGGMIYLEGFTTLAAVTAATLYVQQMLEPVDRLLFWMDELQIGSASLARILGVSRPAADQHAERSNPALPADRRIVLRGASFAYRPGHDAVRDVDLEIEAGERIAIVGPSGAGKSTLARLIAGVHPPRAGSVAVGGVALAELPLSELRRQVCLVTQEHHVFRGTLRENLLIARADATDADLANSLKVVDAWDWAGRLGLDAEIGTGAAALPPARAQQIALARLVLADPHTLILDEATSLLDPQAARHLERSLAAVLEGRTVIAIAHRLHTARDADRIVVMEDGRVVEVGPHEELIKRDGPYGRLWDSWHSGAPPPDGTQR